MPSWRNCAAWVDKLLDELFPTALQRQLWEHRQEIQSIMVISTEPFIPWELVHLRPPGQALLPDEVCFWGQLGLVPQCGSRDTLPPYHPSPHHRRNGIQTYAAAY